MKLTSIKSFVLLDCFKLLNKCYKNLGDSQKESNHPVVFEKLSFYSSKQFYQPITCQGLRIQISVRLAECYKVVVIIHITIKAVVITPFQRGIIPNKRV
jgi:hypothetical protein